jgi:hypothetical protein
MHLEGLIYSVEYTRHEINGLKNVHSALISDLTENSDALLSRAEATSLSSLVAFLQYARRKDSPLAAFHPVIVDELVKDTQALARRGCDAPLNQFISFLNEVNDVNSGFQTRSHEFAQLICASIDIAIWNSRNHVKAPPNPDCIASFARLVSRLGRPELAKIPAEILVTRADVDGWAQPTVGLHQLSSTMRLCRDTDPRTLANFLEAVATPTWLDRNYLNASLGGMAGALLSLATHTPTEFHTVLVRDTLGTRLDNALVSMRPEHHKDWTATVALAGSAAILGITPTKLVALPDYSALSHTIADRRRNDRAFGVMQIQFWVGLRSLVTANSSYIRISPEEIQLAVDAWQNASPPTPFAAACKSSMIDWLRRCHAQDGVLDNSGPSIRQDIMRLI